MIQRFQESSKQRRRIAVLYAQGLTVETIAERLQSSVDAVIQALRVSGLWTTDELMQVRCDACQIVLYTWLRRLPRTCLVYCLPCLAEQKDVSFATRLKSYRLAAGLTQKELAERAGLQGGQISLYEVSRSNPGWHQLVKLVRVLGPGLICVPPIVATRAAR